MTIPTDRTDEEYLIEAGAGVELCTRPTGDPRDPMIVLIAGAACSMDFWPDGLCALLAAGGRQVIRYDARDTGRSTSWPLGAPGYDGADLVDDVIAVLDAHRVDAAHLVGMSLGATTAMRAALRYPDRVRALTLMAATPGGDDLPSFSPRLAAAFEAPDPDWDDPEAVIRHIVEGERPFAGPGRFDETAMRATAEQVLERSRDVAATFANPVFVDYGPSLRDRLGEITAPTLVVHGTDDPLYPLPHGEVLAASIPGARLLVLDRVGHQVTPRDAWHELVPALLAVDPVAPDGAFDLAAAAGAMATAVAEVDDGDLAASTPCAGWDLATLLVHIESLCVGFAAAADKTTTAGVPPDPTELTLPADWRDSIAAGLRRMAAAWREPSAWHGMTYIGGIELPGPVVAAVGIDELIVHAWDLARTIGVPYAIDDDSVAAAQSFVDGVSGPNADHRDPELFGPERPPHPTASPLDRLLSATGRDPSTHG